MATVYRRSNRLTKKQALVLQAIYKYYDERGKVPSNWYLMNELHLDAPKICKIMTSLTIRFNYLKREKVQCTAKTYGNRYVYQYTMVAEDDMKPAPLSGTVAGKFERSDELKEHLRRVMLADPYRVSVLGKR